MMDRNAEELPAIKAWAEMTQGGWGGVWSICPLRDLREAGFILLLLGSGFLFFPRFFSSLRCLFQDAMKATSAGCQWTHGAAGCPKHPPHSGADARRFLIQREIEMIVKEATLQSILLQQSRWQQHFTTLYWAQDQTNTLYIKEKQNWKKYQYLCLLLNWRATSLFSKASFNLLFCFIKK